VIADLMRTLCILQAVVCNLQRTGETTFQAAAAKAQIDRLCKGCTGIWWLVGRIRDWSTLRHWLTAQAKQNCLLIEKEFETGYRRHETGGEKGVGFIY